MDAISASIAGLNNASARFERASYSLIDSANRGGDFSADIVEQIESKIAFEASASTLRIASNMSERLLDILA